MGAQSNSEGLLVDFLQRNLCWPQMWSLLDNLSPIGSGLFLHLSINSWGYSLNSAVNSREGNDPAISRKREAQGRLPCYQTRGVKISKVLSRY